MNKGEIVLIPFPFPNLELVIGRLGNLSQGELANVDQNLIKITNVRLKKRTPT